MTLRNVNLNLLPILRSLLKTTSVSRSASALHLSQPTVSDALSRLRVLLNDELLVRIGSGMKLTPRGAELLGPVDDVCVTLESLLHSAEFDIATVNRDLVIASSDICAYLLLPRILEFLRYEAPAITLHVMDIDGALREKMAAQEIDFALLPNFAIDDLAPAPLRFKPLLNVSYLVVMWSGHPLASKPFVTAEDLAEYPQIVFRPDPVIFDAKRVVSPWKTVCSKTEVRISQMTLIPQLLVGSESFAVVNSQLATDMASMLPLTSRPAPFPELHRSFGLTWSPIYEGEASRRRYQNLR